jgi:hypothetical protein
LPTRGQNAHVGTLAQQSIDKSSARFYQVLAVIEDEQALAVLKRPNYGIRRLLPGRFAYAECFRDALRYGAGIHHGCELRKETAVAVGTSKVSSDLKREARFADSTRAGECHEAPVTEKLGDGCALVFAADEGRESDRPVRTDVRHHAWLVKTERSDTTMTSLVYRPENSDVIPRSRRSLHAAITWPRPARAGMHAWNE